MTAVNHSGRHNSRIVGICGPDCKVLALEIDILKILVSSWADYYLITGVGVIDGLLNRRIGLLGCGIFNRLGYHVIRLDVHGVGMDRRAIFIVGSDCPPGLLEREGVISLRYEFVEVLINGENWGLYALEEHFEKRLVEHNRRREGPIIRFNEDLIWRALSKQIEAMGHRDLSKINTSGTFMSADIDAFETREIISNPLKYKQFISAVTLLESFRRGEMKASDVFDVNKFAKFF